MDKYQEQMLNQTSVTLSTNNNEAGQVELKGESIILTQNENYNCLQYNLVFKNNDIESIEILRDRGWEIADLKSINIDFENPIKKIKINFALVDSIELEVVYVLANRELYDKKISEEKKEEYKYESNARLVYNIFGAPTVIFDPCCSDYGYTEVEFIATSDSGTTESVFPSQDYCGCSSYGGSYKPPKRKDVNVVLQRKKNEEGCNYIQFTNIGKCGLKAHVYQYDKKGHLLVDYIIN